jgi:Holliday junction DNA helicase RuvA
VVGYLQGKLLSKSQGSVVVVLAGEIGYEVTLTSRQFEGLVLETPLSLWIHTHVREDILMLYGFATEPEKQFFRILLGVSGLGPRTALSLLSEHGAERLSQLIVDKEVDEITSAPGVGKKLAQRLVLELAGKIEKLAWVSQREKKSVENRAQALPPRRQLREDLSSALLNLGYQPNRVGALLDKLLEAEDDLGFEGYLRSALKELSGRPASA